jgi:hypothetical protein
VLTSWACYDDKFGLVAMFGNGLQLVPLNSDGLEERLVYAVDSAWERGLRNPLALGERWCEVYPASRASNRLVTSCKARTGPSTGPTAWTVVET